MGMDCGISCGGDLRAGLSKIARRVPKPGPLGAEATLGAPANQLGQPFGSRGVARKARRPPKTKKLYLSLPHADFSFYSIASGLA
jgi:hypothetical protein